MSRKLKVLHFFIKHSAKIGLFIFIVSSPLLLLAAFSEDSGNHFFVPAIVISLIALCLIFAPNFIETSRWFHILEVEDYKNRLPKVQKKVNDSIVSAAELAELVQIACHENVEFTIDISPITRLRNEYFTIGWKKE